MLLCEDRDKTDVFLYNIVPHWIETKDTNTNERKKKVKEKPNQLSWSKLTVNNNEEVVSNGAWHYSDNLFRWGTTQLVLWDFPFTNKYIYGNSIYGDVDVTETTQIYSNES